MKKYKLSIFICFAITFTLIVYPIFTQLLTAILVVIFWGLGLISVILYAFAIYKKDLEKRTKQRLNQIENEEITDIEKN